jgi:hypothetical protein
MTLESIATKLAEAPERARAAMPTLRAANFLRPAPRHRVTGEVVAAFGLGIALGVALGLLLATPLAEAAEGSPTDDPGE